MGITAKSLCIIAALVCIAASVTTCSQEEKKLVQREFISAELSSAYSPDRLSCIAIWKDRPVYVYFQDDKTLSIFDVCAKKELMKIDAWCATDTSGLTIQPPSWCAGEDKLYIVYYDRRDGWRFVTAKNESVTTTGLLPGQMLAYGKEYPIGTYPIFDDMALPKPGEGIPFRKVVRPGKGVNSNRFVPCEPCVTMSPSSDGSVEGIVDVAYNLQYKDEGSASSLIWFRYSDGKFQYLQSGDHYDFGPVALAARQGVTPAVLAYYDYADHQDNAHGMVNIKEILASDDALSIGRTLKINAGYIVTWLRMGTGSAEDSSQYCWILVTGSWPLINTVKTSLYMLDRDAFTVKRVAAYSGLPYGGYSESAMQSAVVYAGSSYVVLNALGTNNAQRYRVITPKESDSGYHEMEDMKTSTWRQSFAAVSPTGEIWTVLVRLPEDRESDEYYLKPFKVEFVRYEIQAGK
jgi:hypothetical protein